MSARPRFYVRVDRSDGSRTYKGAWDAAHCERERAAWLDSFPEYVVDVVPVDEARADVRNWTKATKDGGRYVPPEPERSVVR